MSRQSERQAGIKNYRWAFEGAVLMNIFLAAGLGYVWWTSHGRGTTQKPATEGSESVGQATGGQSAGVSSGGASPAAPETPLAPVQLTPQRLQSIGVETGTVEIKNVSDEIRTVGDVEIDETKLAYVQV